MKSGESAVETRPSQPETSQRSDPWHLNLGATIGPEGVTFRVWAPTRRTVEVVLADSGRAFPMDKDDDGYFTALVAAAAAGMIYRYRVDEGQQYPDPCSRYQPEGPHGPSAIVDPNAYLWRDQQWPGVKMQGQVIYELHVGAFTPEGTLDSAISRLDGLKELGITMIEIMPVAEFPGRWNWGYDGVGLYAPAHMYGDHEALKRFVDEAHGRALGVILDVVYNHLGPDGNYLPTFNADYFTDRYANEWGQAINFDGPQSEEVREFFIQNACYWIAEFHLDGLRLDATQAIHDAGSSHVLAELSQSARQVAHPRTIVLMAENEPQDILAVIPTEQGGWGLDAMWNDDFHHAARVALTGRREAYYTDYYGSPQELLSAAKRGFLYQGQRYQWQEKPRGSVVTDQPASSLVLYVQNHDQVANSLHGARLPASSDSARYRAILAFMLLSPGTPLLFMGQEWGASTPFLFFTDVRQDLSDSVYEGRKEFLAQFPSYGSPEAQASVPHPCDPTTFTRSKLDWSERERNAGWRQFHQDLLRLRREDPVIARQDRQRLEGAVLGPQALVMRYAGEHQQDRLIVVNFGQDLDFMPAPEPLLAPVEGGAWQLVWSSDDPRYGGPGIVNPLNERGWRIPGHSATLFSVGRR